MVLVAGVRCSFPGAFADALTRARSLGYRRGMSKQFDEQALARVMTAAGALWLEPELQRRIARGELPDGFKLTAFQIITDAEGIPRETRLNDEVRGVVRRRSAVEVAKDDLVFGNTKIDMPEILLTEADPNAAHFTALLTEEGWIVSWDMRVNAREAAEHAKAAREFLDSARTSLADGRMRPFVQNLLDGTELMATAYLLTRQDVKPGRTHRSVANPFNVERRAGRVDESFSKLLNNLRELRRSARYLRSDFALETDEANAMMATAEQMYRALYDVVPKRHAASS
jgi:uncharacterized protein (UPF0332 family)